MTSLEDIGREEGRVLKMILLLLKGAGLENNLRVTANSQVCCVSYSKSQEGILLHS